MEVFLSYDIQMTLSFFMEHNRTKTHKMKLLLSAFEQALDLKINFHKIKWVVLLWRCPKCIRSIYKELFGCQSGEFSIRYLGILVRYKKLRKKNWEILIGNKWRSALRSDSVVGWKGKHHSIGGRLTLINSMLSSLPMYIMSFFPIPRSVLKKLDYFGSRFYWQGDEQRKKYRLAKWSVLCQPKDQGGLGIHTKDMALLSKWLFKLLTSDETWQQFLQNKYLGSKPLA
jgi:hypothetical protein